MPLLHGISSFMAFLMEHLIRYRFEVISQNLRHAFPEKSEAELVKLRRAFYLNFCDVMLETLKMLSISKENLKKRVKPLNPGEIPHMVEHGGGGIAVFAHYANWEWLGAGMGRHLPFGTTGIYKPLNSKVFDRLMVHIRTRHGNDMVPMDLAYRESLKRLRKPEYIAFLGDQSPTPNPKMYYTEFMNRPAPFTLGIATLAIKLKCPVYYFDVRRVRRGYYSVQLRRIPYDDLLELPRAEAVAALTDRNVEMLESILRESPEAWLWSHKRWKFKPKPQSRLSVKLRKDETNFSPGQTDS